MEFDRPFRVVTPTVDGDVLAALAVADGWFTPARLHRVLGRHSEDGVRRSLGRLAEQGIVTTLPGGNATLYCLNPHHLAVEPVIRLANLRSALVERIASRLRTWSPPPIYAALFGSAAWGGMTTASDIDILIIRDTSAKGETDWDTAVLDLQLEVSLWTGNDGRVLSMIDEHVRRHGAEEPVLADVAARGIVLVGERDWLSQTLDAARG